MYGLVLTLAALTSLAAGYYAGAMSRASEEQELAEALARESQSPSHSLTFALSVITQEQARALGQRIKGKLAVESALDSIEKTPKENELYRACGQDELGKRLGRSLIAGRHPEIPGVDLYMKNFIEEIAHDPANGVTAVRTGLDRLPASEFPLERMSLLSALASNPANSDVVKAMALAELTQDPPPPRPDPSQAQTADQLDASLSTTADQARPIAAQGLDLRTTSDPNEALSGTVAAITAQTDWGVRASLAQQFVTAYPNMSSNLTEALAAQGITLSQGPSGATAKGD